MTQPRTPLLSEKEVEEQYGLLCLQTRRHRGTSPPWVKIGRRVFYEREAVEAWIAEHRRTSTWAPSKAA